jgi:hypothetical protein
LKFLIGRGAQQQTEQDTENEAGGERDMKREMLPANREIAGQPAEPDLAEHGPQQPDRYDDQPDCDQKP